MSENDANKQREEQKELIKEAIKEWMNEKYASFGRSVFWFILAAAFSALVYLSIRGGQWPQS